MTTEMPRALAAVVRQQLVEAGWRAGTTLEDRVALQLRRWGFSASDVAQQHRALSYRLDFAWPALKVALEADGPRHLYDPQTARRDAERDARLRADGWLVFRVDDEGGELVMYEQLLRVVQIVRALTEGQQPGQGRARSPRQQLKDERAIAAARRLGIDDF